MAGDRSAIVNRFLHPSSDTGIGNFYSGGQPHSLRQEENSVHSLLLSISSTLSDVQSQLSEIKQQNIERDLSLKRLVQEVESIKEIKVGDPQPPVAKRSRRSPRGLSACVRRVHAALDDDVQYRGTEGVGSEHNTMVTQRIVNDVANLGEFMDRREIEYAAKKHHEYLARQEKEESPEAKAVRLKTSRITQRRIRLFERRCMQAKGKEVDIMQQLNEKVMSDEETDCDEPSILVKRTPPWRSEKLTNLIRALDNRKDDKSEAVPKKERKTGPPSLRKQPTSLPKWAVSCSTSASPVQNQASSSEQRELSSPAQSQLFSPAPSQTSSPTQSLASQPSTPTLVRSSTRVSHRRVSLPLPPIHTPLSSRVHLSQQERDVQCGLSSNDSFSGESSPGDNCDSDDEMSCWIRAVTGVK